MSEELDLRKKIFSINFNKAMELKGIQQSDLVKDLHLNSSTVSNWSQGVMLPRSDKLTQLSDYLGVSEASLMGWEKGQSGIEGVAEFDHKIGDRMRELREKEGITAEEAANKLKMDYSLYCNYEDNKKIPTNSELVEIAKLYHSTINYLLKDMVDTFNFTIEVSDPDEQHLLYNYRQLTDLGKKKGRDYIDDLSLIKDYRADGMLPLKYRLKKHKRTPKDMNDKEEENSKSQEDSPDHRPPKTDTKE